MYEKVNGAKRLMNALYQHDDTRTRSLLARALDYYEPQLNEDIQALRDYIRDAEEIRQSSLDE